MEARVFASEPLFEGQEDHSGSVSANLEYYQDFDDGYQQFVFTGFGRVDSADDERTYVDLRELYWWKDFNQVELFIGARKVFWGVTESVQIVDIINQTDVVENINRDEKLGQPMVQLVFEQDWGTLEAFVLPYFREQTFPGAEGRLRPGLPIIEPAQYQSTDEESHVDLALRWSHYFSVWDIGLSHFSGTSRDPIFLPVFNDASDPIGLVQFYPLIEQTGLDLQATVGAWLWKLELASLYQKDAQRNTRAAGGLEYTFFTVGGGNSDIGVIAEYQFDDRPEPIASIAQNDLALGMRWALNDIDGSEFLFIYSRDLDSSNTFVSAEVSRRITDRWKIEAQAITFIDIEPDTLEFDLRDDDHLQIEMRYYF